MSRPLMSGRWKSRSTRSIGRAARSSSASVARCATPATTKPGTATGRRGLGLALVSTAAARLGGRVGAANDGGAVLTVEVPARSHAAIGAP